MYIVYLSILVYARRVRYICYALCKLLDFGGVFIRLSPVINITYCVYILLN